VALLEIPRPAENCGRTDQLRVFAMTAEMNRSVTVSMSVLRPFAPYRYPGSPGLGVPVL